MNSFMSSFFFHMAGNWDFALAGLWDHWQKEDMVLEDVHDHYSGRESPRRQRPP